MSASESDPYLIERLNRVERDLETTKTTVANLVTQSAVTDTLLIGIRDALKEIKESITQTRSTISRVGWIFVTAFVGIFVVWIANGGMGVVN